MFQIGGGNNDQTPSEILAIPHLLSLLATNHWNGKVVGLSSAAGQQYSSQFGPGNYVPNVFIQYWSMRAMAYLGVVVLLISLWGPVVDPAQETRDVAGVPVGGGVGRRAAVPPDEHQRSWLLTESEKPQAADGSCRASC